MNPNADDGRREFPRAFLKLARTLQSEFSIKKKAAERSAACLL